MSDFGQTIAAAYAAEGAAIDLGRGVHAEALSPQATATTGGADMIGDFLRSREGQALGEKVARGVFGVLRKRL